VGEADDREEDDPRHDQDDPDGEHRAHAALGIPRPSGKYPNPISFPTFSSQKVEISATVPADIVQ
jgi:hypothetical protein